MASALHRCSPRRALCIVQHQPRTRQWNRHIDCRHRLFATQVSLEDTQDPDVLIVGTGAAGLTAALRAKHHGLKPLVIEKGTQVGGTSAWSGGGLWIPNSHLNTQNPDSVEEALKYLENIVGDVGAVSSKARKLAFLQNGSRMAKWLEEQGFAWTLCHGYPDYFPEAPGGKPGGRTIEPKMFDLNKLGNWKPLMERSAVRAPIPMYAYEATKFVRAKSGGWDERMMALRVLTFRFGREKLMGRDPVTLGQSLVAQLLKLCVDRQIPIVRETPLRDLLIEKGKISGAVVFNSGKEQVIRASKVLLAAGGFARNKDMRMKYQGLPPDYSNVAPNDHGDAITIAQKHNLATTLLDDAWWGPTTRDPSTGQTYWCQFERTLPHSIIVDKSGQRFTNESKNYNAIGHDIIARNKNIPAIPSYLIMDARHRSRYILANKFMPGITPQSAIDSGFVFKAPTLQDLAKQLDVDAEGLKSTVARFNSFVPTGIDEDFNRGASVYDSWFGDTTSNYGKNGNLGSIERAPFYAIKVWPGDLGTKGGLLTDENAQALNEDSNGNLETVKGLYAVGNSSASVMGRTYAGAGATLGPAMSFAFRAVDHIAESKN